MDELPAKLNVASITMAEPALQGVKQDDRLLVRNIIYILHACRHPERLCLSWNVPTRATATRSPA